MALSLYDTLAQKKIPFSPRTPGEAKIYVCGPTTYDHAHIGHARPCVVYDVLVRHLRAQGLQVTYVRNVTDIDDKIIQRAAQNGEEPAALAARMFASYRADMESLGNLSPDIEPKVSEHLEEIIALVAKLEERGHAYSVDGDVYFEVSSFQEYGKLSHRDLSQMEAGASERVESEELRRKRHPYDFALWKAAKPGEPAWDSPWGPGRPGWHIECSAMSMRYLGETVDLHGGGLDLVFPHHENELAQSECASGSCFARHWMHNGFVQVNKEKMSKSLGNFFRLGQAFEFAEPEAVRYSLLSVHYRAPYNLEVDLDEAGHLLAFPQFGEAEDRLAYLYTTIKRYLDFPAERIVADASPIPPEIEQFEAKLNAALDDDLNTAQALGQLALLLKAMNEKLDASLVKKAKLSQVTHERMGQALQLLKERLGLGLQAPEVFLERLRDTRAQRLGIDKAWVEAKLAERAAARAAKDFALADAARNALAERGVEILDSTQGSSWRLSRK